MKKLTIAITISTLICPSVQAYDWQKHVPDEAKQYIPSNVSNKSGTTNGSTKHYGPISIQGTTQDSLVSHGPATIIDSIITTFTSYGPAKVTNSKIKLIDIHGPFSGDNVELHAGEVKGVFTLTNSKITGSFEIKGLVKITKTQISKDIVIYSSSVTFVDTNIHENVYIYSDTKIPKVSLTNTFIDGKIIFVQKAGKIISDGKSKINGDTKQDQKR